MKNWKKYAFAVMMVTVAGFAYTKISQMDAPSDFRDAPGEDASAARIAKLQGLKVSDIKGLGEIPAPVAGRAVPIEPFQPVEWVSLGGGKFMMGVGEGGSALADNKPLHEVSVKAFAMSKTPVTVEQFAECVKKGLCGEPFTGKYCNWGVPGRERHPVNCVDWYQADQYAGFIGGRLPSESEWEYAARSASDKPFPWAGTDNATCDRVVMWGNGGACSKQSTMPVCSKPRGNTAQGLCDMIGNVRQWVQDNYQNSYRGAPADGSAFEGGLSGSRVQRGGSFSDYDFRLLRVDNRSLGRPGDREYNVGIRLARSKR